MDDASTREHTKKRRRFVRGDMATVAADFSDELTRSFRN